MVTRLLRTMTGWPTAPTGRPSPPEPLLQPRRLATALVAALTAALVLAGASFAASCGRGGYSYAGLIGDDAAYGVRATVTAVSAPQVERGHSAAWVGVGGMGAGPNGADEWLQVGLAAFEGSGSRLYFEVTLPGQRPEYVELAADVPAGESHRVAVLEMASRRSHWRVWVDGEPVAGPYFLPGSHGAWQPVVTAESWDANAGACNRYSYRFDGLSFKRRHGGGWKKLSGGYVLEDPGFRFTRLAPASFVATDRA